MTFDPKGTIYLCQTPLENDYLNQLTFNDSDSQFNYFSSKILKTFTEYTYVKRDNVVKVNAKIDDIINCNYLFYNNGGFTNKYYYCFITNMQYVNEEVTAITFETDVIQTWLFDINFNKCFIERKHVTDDAIGLNTIPENLELGPYVNNGDSIQSTIGNENYICVGVTENILTESSDLQEHLIYNGVIGGLIYILLKDSLSVDVFIKKYANAGKSESIQMLFMIPKEFARTFEWVNIPDSQGNYYVLPESANAYNLTGVSIIVNKKIATNYTPKNNKLLTYPYRYLLASNNAGVDVVYRYEDFKYAYDTGIGFNIVGSISAGCNIKCVPTFYKNLDDRNYEEGFNVAKFPVGSWITDVYTNWLTQNGVNIGLSLVGSGASIISGGLAMGGKDSSLMGVGQVFSGIMGVAQTLGQVYSHSLIPDQVKGNINSSDVMFGVNKIGPTFYNMSIKEEYAKIIDDYFNMYGYKVNVVEEVKIKTRKYWNFIKTINCNFDGNIPQADLKIIKTIFDKGITFWHSPENIYNYNLNNTII